eukprot:TRINITY_DN8592_c0_g1_i1.p1 TRINITY_DN8592_c0_g1~~TRINITY_DN8592_c0_g1_i1.p1  ORF type:complete len:202 (-),score=55.58 TRINITY_DN8592_c0_g1_i1:10-585(-)
MTGTRDGTDANSAFSGDEFSSEALARRMSMLPALPAIAARPSISLPSMDSLYRSPLPPLQEHRASVIPTTTTTAPGGTGDGVIARRGSVLPQLSIAPTGSIDFVHPLVRGLIPESRKGTMSAERRKSHIALLAEEVALAEAGVDASDAMKHPVLEEALQLNMAVARVKRITELAMGDLPSSVVETDSGSQY